ncbi:MAG: hypothetical protein QOI38_16 [Sphingomonadales bacterium]|nr:hypothetical protein [Sphingomonadales bacterium]
MRFKPFLFLGACLAPIAAASAGPVAPAQPAYLVSMTLRDGERLVAEPRLQVDANRPADIVLTDKEGDRYRMRFTVAPHGDGVVALRSSIAVARASGAERRVEPVLLVGFEAPAAIEFGVDGAGEPLTRIGLRIQPVEAGAR